MGGLGAMRDPVAGAVRGAMIGARDNGNRLTDR